MRLLRVAFVFQLTRDFSVPALRPGLPGGTRSDVENLRCNRLTVCFSKVQKRKRERERERKEERGRNIDSGRSKIRGGTRLAGGGTRREAGSRAQWTRYDTRAIIHAAVARIRLTATLIYSRSCLSRAATRVRHGDR